MPFSPLHTLKVVAPCPRSWEQMTGTDAERFCAHCQKHVHNLSAMTTSEAERLVCESAGSLCVCYEATAAGTPITLDYQKAVNRRPRWLWPVTAVATLSATVAAFLFANTLNRPKPPVIMVGDIGPRSAPAPQTQCPAPAKSE